MTFRAASEPKPFQVATVEAVLASLRAPSLAGRFLVADEVGLGKTVVAQQVIRRLAEDKSGPLRVFYVCSNLSIARQNETKLLELLPPDERESARCPVDRLTLVPAHADPTNRRLHLYCITPGTSVPMRRGKRRDGRADERALVQALVEAKWPAFFKYFDDDFFVRAATSSFHWRLDHQRKKVADSPGLRERYYSGLRRELKLEPGYHVVTELRRIRRERGDLEVIVRLRNALAASAIHDLEPDLVIFDEFQRFRDLLNPDLDEAAARVIERLRGDTGSAKLLLLSATPYRLFSTAEENTHGSPHHREFYELIEFLYGAGEQAAEVRARAEELFGQLAGELAAGRLNSACAEETREEIRALLRPVMCRTERASHADGFTDFKTFEWGADVRAADIKVFEHLTESLDDRHRSLGVYYWSSIPLPMQAMLSDYTVRKHATPHPKAPPGLTEQERDEWSFSGTWPHPKQRALDALLPNARLRVPWVAPSLPWWRLGGLWQSSEARAGKSLLFSRFRAVPTIVSALTSYRLEADIFGGATFDWAEASERRLFAAGEDPALVALFHPWAVGEWIDPVTAPTDLDRDDLVALARKEIKRALDLLDVSISDTERARPFWNMLARLEHKVDPEYWEGQLDAWRVVHDAVSRGDSGERGVLTSLAKWEEAAEEELRTISTAELEQLAWWSLAAPGVVAFRTLNRHVEQPPFEHSIAFAWTGLRNFFAQRWVADALNPHGTGYREAMLDAIFDGNLEAVLDEHFWVTAKLRHLSDAELVQEVNEALRIRTSSVRVHHPTSDDKQFALRCHVAMPFVGARYRDADGGGSFRPDELRRSFNSPFWPHVLSTTSVGQEGLDFHAWCQEIVHWDLPRNPVDLEQREGRIQRFAGLAVRRAIARELGDEALARVRELTDGEEPNFPSAWKILEGLAESALEDDSGLSPWWITPNSDIRRFVFDVPTSRDRRVLKDVKHKRLLYRLALGQPNQEDLVERIGDVDQADARCASIGLSPFFDR